MHVWFTEDSKLAVGVNGNVSGCFSMCFLQLVNDQSRVYTAACPKSSGIGSISPVAPLRTSTPKKKMEDGWMDFKYS